MGKGNRNRNNNYQDTYSMSGSGAAAKSARAPQKKDHTTAIMVAVIAVLLIATLAFVLFGASGCEGRYTEVISSENYEVSANMLSFYQMATYYSAYGEAEAYYKGLFGSSSELGSYMDEYVAQYASQYAMQQADFSTVLDTCRSIVVRCEKARAAGLSLSDEDNTTISNAVDSYGSDFSTAFGTGISKKDAVKMLELELLASKFYDKFVEETKAEVTDEDIAKHIEENKDGFYAADYLKFDISLLETDYKEGEFETAKLLPESYKVKFDSANSADEFRRQVINYLVDCEFVKESTKESFTDDEALATAKKTISDTLFNFLVKNEAVDVTDEALTELYTTLKKTCAEALKTLSGAQAYTETGDEDALWLVNSNTKQFDVKITEKSSKTEYKYSAYMLTEPLRLSPYKTVNVKHILVKAEKATSTAEDLIAAKKEADSILASYLDGEKTKEAFEKLGKEKTDDSSVTYDNVAYHQMVAEFNDWIFDPNRKEGDTDIVQTSFGYHVIYWAGNGENLAENGYVNELYQAMIEEGEKSLTLNEKFIAKYTETTTAE